MPTYLGALPSNVQAPIALSRENRGTNYGGYNIDPGSLPNGTPLPDAAAGNGYAITRTLARPAYLVAELQMAILGLRASWDYGVFGIRISPADLDGVVLGNYLYAPVNNACNFRTHHCIYPFRCGAGTYTIYATTEGGNWSVQYYISPGVTFLTVEQIGEGVL